ncbi:NAD-glutamate dehydrogenase domain-containing protein [Gordonia sp. CPCC 205515]|uniref:NAD-glutamate dehydrogenase domain-containing protein n=1 Tax=Gordonia sp. CPCC 205515 TaxID=3140791 RepID=UPI003AF39ED5
MTDATTMSHPINTPRLSFDASAPNAARLHADLHWPQDAPTMTGLVATFGHFGLEVISHAGTVDDTGTATGRLTLRTPEMASWNPAAAERISAAFGLLRHDRFEVDGFLRLTATALLRTDEVVLIRALCRYVAQCGLSIASETVVSLLSTHPDVVRGLLDLFTARLDPAVSDRGPAIEDAEQRLDTAIATATTLDADRLFRALRSAVRATLRTNWFQHGVPLTRAMVLKLDPSLVELPAAVTPYRELFVHSATVEGSHVRGGPIARGGLRHSERPSDFRTEVLGLMRTQVVKNSLIVPVGAKGAFVVRGGDLTPTRVRAAYTEFIEAMLDVTDNRSGEEIIHPADTVVTDGPDPYLVVAADKGTARFSDTANAIAVRRGFWLGDAFASGGSTGYDHKAMGITARGAWLGVRRHLSETGIEFDTTEFTVAGIGDMSGDVFGNGMLSTPTIRLVAAFDHRHIFLDPTPDARTSFFERQRLLHLPSSSWDDYDRSLISAGGGVWPRTAKSIALSPAARRALDVEATELPPHELISAILRAPVDLLFNGGVGTYVKASTESASAAGDPANDMLRVDADTVRATVIGEGGNLGLTQRARVEYALAGGRINGDFIDNAAGVATSDREVNLKIALDDAVRSGALAGPDRDDLLATLTDDVAAAVLADCDRQTLALSLAESNSSFLLGRHARLIENLEATTGMDRSAEVLPTSGQLAVRMRDGSGLVRPEIAVLLAMSKNVVRAELLASTVPDDPGFAHILTEYFPSQIRDLLGDNLSGHRVAREIVAVRLANDIIDHVGPGFVYRAEERFGTSTPEIVSAYALVSATLGVGDRWDAVLERTDLDHESRLALLTELQTVIEEATGWVLRQRRVLRADPAGWAARIRAYAPMIAQLGTAPSTGDDNDATVPAGLATALPIADDAGVLDLPVERVAQVHRLVAERFGLDRLRVAARDTATGDYWEAMSAAIVAEEIGEAHHDLVRLILTDTAADATPAVALEDWTGRHDIAVARLDDVLRRLVPEALTGAQARVAAAEVRLLADRSRPELTPAR